MTWRLHAIHIVLCVAGLFCPYLYYTGSGVLSEMRLAPY
jgi:hypothetical protein